MVSISLDNVTVDLPIYTATDRSFRRAIATIGVGGRLLRGEKSYVSVRALDGISVSLKSGDRLGVIGINGAGKTTLLRVMGGLLEPTYGRIRMAGQISTLLSIDALMDQEMTGRENVYHVSQLIGLTPHEGQSLLDDVWAFSELGDFMDLPVRTYSAGMRVRLSFGLMTAQHPEILILDEAIAAGDSSFTVKARNRFMGLTERTRIIVLACHSRSHLEALCQQVLWLEKGRIRALGPIDEVLDAYDAYLADINQDPTCFNQELLS